MTTYPARFVAAPAAARAQGAGIVLLRPGESLMPPSLSAAAIAASAALAPVQAGDVTLHPGGIIPPDVHAGVVMQRPPVVAAAEPEVEAVVPPTAPPMLYVGVSNAGTPATCQVVVVDTGTDTVIANIPISPPGTAFVTIGSTEPLAITPDQSMVFAQTSENFGGLVGIDAATNTVSFYDNSTTGFSWTPVAVAMVLKGGTGELYMPNNRANPNGRVLRLNQSNVLGTEIHVEPRRYTFAAASPDNAWVALAGTQAFLGIVDTSTDAYTDTALAGGSRFPTWLPDSASVYITRVSGSNTVIDRFDAPGFASATTFTPFSDNKQRNLIVINRAGTKMYCIGDVDVAVLALPALTLIGSPVAIPAAGNNACILPDDSKLYISTASGLLPYDTATDTVGSNIAVGTNAQGMCVKVS